MSLVLQDLISEVTCSEPYEWKDTTEHEWEFQPPLSRPANGAQPFNVKNTLKHPCAYYPFLFSVPSIPWIRTWSR